jgi:glycerophosphoryl diester phosphodiesterase
VTTWLRADHPLLVAHRGWRAHAPEQTMVAFEAAIAHGAEMIEADALLTRDGRLALMHDTEVDRTTDGHGLVSDLTWDEIAALDAGSWFDAAFAGLRVPRAEDLLALARDAGISVCLEAKGETPAETTRVAVALATLISESGATDWAFVSSFDHAALQAARMVVDGLLLAPERLPQYGPQVAEETLRQAVALGAPVIQHRWELIEPDVVQTLHDHGVAIWAWNTNDEQSVDVALRLGVDGVIGDDIDLLVQGREALDPGRERR